ncbi:MAG: GTP 3',8-cyclase [Gammaproteobacteria bacterium]|nr:GTP 3',8-cyclase [Gammaproteobacteria bacterium]
MTVQDALQRPIRDLRISVTDRCNFRCVYCMPKHVFGPGHEFLPRSELLTYEEIARLARSFAAIGVGKFRLTGGEPLIRRDLVGLIGMLSGIEGVEDISLTTNGSMLTPDKARTLKQAGLRRITVSLDALDNQTFMMLNDVDYPVQKVLDALDNAEAAGLSPVKVNVVVKKGVNDHSIIPLVRYFHGSSHIVRFIEYMDVGHSNGWRLDDVVPAAEIAERINAELPIEPAEPNYRGEVAQRWRFVDGGGEVGIVSSVTQPFCRSCHRARLSARGELYTCLFAARGHDLRRLVRDTELSDDELTDRLSRIWSVRDDRYSEIRSENTLSLPKVEMSYIGG